MAGVLLVVDDSAADRMLLRRVLDDGRAVGLGLIEAADATACRRVIAERDDVAGVVMDNRLAGVDGLTLLAELGLPDDVWVVLATGQDDDGLRTLATAAGVDAVLIKGSLDAAATRALFSRLTGSRPTTT